MKFVLAIAGIILSATAVSMNKVSAWGNECYYFGSRPSLDSCMAPHVFYGLLFAGLLSLAAAAVLFLRESSNSTNNTAAPHTPTYRTFENPNPIQSAQSQAVAKEPSPNSDSDTWKTLKEFDEDIRAAVSKISSFGAQAEERLATAFLSVRDKALLPSIVTKITADEEAEASRREADTAKDAERRAEMALKYSRRDLELLKDREERAKYTIAQIEAAGMVYAGKKVVSAEMHYGENPHDQGWAKIIYGDGTAELRAGSSFTVLKTD